MFGEQGNPLIPFLLIIGIFYFLVLRPERTKQKEHKQRVAALQKNDQVVTIGGLHGTVVNVKETTVILRVDDSVKVEVDKEAISTVKKKEA